MSLQDLKRCFHTEGNVEWLGIRPARKEHMQIVREVTLAPGKGIIGDRFKGNLNSKRQVSLIQKEHIDMMEQMLGSGPLKPETLRRNIVVSGLNLLALKQCVFTLGSATLEMTDHCHPCSRMEAALGKGGFNLMRGHGGILARVVVAGQVKIDDKLIFQSLK